MRFNTIFINLLLFFYNKHSFFIDSGLDFWYSSVNNNNNLKIYFNIGDLLLNQELLFDFLLKILNKKYYDRILEIVKFSKRLIKKDLRDLI